MRQQVIITDEAIEAVAELYAESEDTGSLETAKEALQAAALHLKWRPRTIATVEELDALPFESVIMDDHKRVFYRWLLAGWQSAGPTLGTSIALPATVLHEATA